MSAMTVLETIAQGRQQVESLRLAPFERTQLMRTLRSIEQAVAPARSKASEALTILNDSSLRNDVKVVGVRPLVRDVIAHLDGFSADD